MKKYTVLIADDNRELCAEIEKEIMALQALQVLPSTHDGDATITSIQRYRPDIIVLDLIMPVYDGLYVINYIHNQMKNYYPFIYVLSAIGMDKTNKIMQNINVDYYSVKPIAPQAVAANLMNISREWIRPGTLILQDPAYEEQHPERGAHISINVEMQVDDYLYDLGAPLYRVSTKCLRIALRLALEEEPLALMNLYKKTSEIVCGELSKAIKPSAVERNVRSAVAYIQNISNPYFLECFPKQKKKLTNSDFIQRSIYIVKLRVGDFLSDSPYSAKNRRQ